MSTSSDRSRAGEGVLPNFIIIGAQKAGTTTLYRMLQQHPEVFLPELKEPGFFIRAFPDPVRFQTLRRPDDGREARPIGSHGAGTYSLAEYHELFEPGAEFSVRGEASTPYLPSPYAARRVAETIPDARLIVILRDPVERAYSAYNYNLSRGMEPAATFAEAIDSELRGERDDWIYGWRYLYTGRYAEHLARWLEFFPREQLLVLWFEELRDNPGLVYRTACRHLGVDGLQVGRQRRDNVTTIPGNPILRALRSELSRPSAWRRAARRVLPASLRRRMSRAALAKIDRFGHRPPPLEASQRASLEVHFEDANESLRRLLEPRTDFPAWLR